MEDEIGIADKISIDDLEVAWEGFSLPIPFVWPEPSKQEYLFLYFGTILSVSAGLLFTIFEFFMPTIFCFLGVALCSIGLYHEKRKYNEALSARRESLQAKQDAIETQKIEIAKANRGYQFIGENYQSWLDDGISNFRDKIIRDLDIQEFNVSAFEVNLQIETPVKAPTSPEIYEYGVDPYPLPEKVGCIFYLLTHNMLIIVPPERVRVSSNKEVPDKKTEREVSSDFSQTFFPIDIGSISRECLTSEDSGGLIREPTRIPSYKLQLRNIIGIEYGQTTSDGKNSIVITMKDDKLIEIPATKEIYDLLRQNLKN